MKFKQMIKLSSLTKQISLISGVLLILLISTSNALAWMEQAPAESKALPGEEQLTSGTFTLFLSKKVVKGDKGSTTYRYSARLTDSGQSVISGASLSFEGYDSEQKGSFLKPAVEKKAGIYEVEITIPKGSSWDIAILGKHEPYPFRMSFKETSASGTVGNKYGGGVPILPGSSKSDQPAPAKKANISIVQEKDRYVLYSKLLYIGLGILGAGSLLQYLRSTSKTK